MRPDENPHGRGIRARSSIDELEMMLKLTLIVMVVVDAAVSHTNVVYATLLPR